MITKTEAIVLRITPFSKTSQVVSWLTPGHGKVMTSIKGARRPKSWFLGQYDLFYTCELLFYAREHDLLHAIKECTPLKPRTALRADWQGAACASYVCDFASRVSLRGGHQPEVYGLTSMALDCLSAGGASLQFIFWFELKMLAVLGLKPRLTVCTRCDRPLPMSGASSFSTVRGGVLCSNCDQARRDPEPVGIPMDVLAILRNWQNSTSPRTARSTRCSDTQLLACQNLLATFLTYHLETGILVSSRSIAIALLQRER